MDPTDLQLARTLCDMVGAPHLPAYLGLGPAADPQTLQGRLQERRRFLQGMATNPKYAQEAELVIRQHAALERVIGDLSAHLADRAAAIELALPKVHAAVAELLAVGLGAGPMGSEWVGIIRRAAHEFGVSSGEFDALYQKVEAASPAKIVAGDAEADPVGDRLIEAHLGIDAGEVPANAVRRYLAQLPDPVEYDELSEEAALPGWVPQSRLEILGDPERTIPLGSEVIEDHIVVRNAGVGQMPGRVEVDVPWLSVSPPRLHALAPEQTLVVHIDPGQVPLGGATGAVTIRTDRGHEGRVVFTLGGAWSKRNLFAVGLTGAMLWMVLAVLAVVIGILVGINL